MVEVYFHKGWASRVNYNKPHQKIRGAPVSSNNLKNLVNVYSPLYLRRIGISFDSLL